MIHTAYIKSEIAKRYFKATTGEDLTRQKAVNRWRQIIPDNKILKKVIDQVQKEQKKILNH